MSLNVFIGSLCVLLLFLFTVKIDCQGIRFLDNGERSYCNCIVIRRCFVLRNRRDWRTAGETCEFGYGENRGVCCPPSVSRRRATGRPRPNTRPIRPRPNVPPVDRTTPDTVTFSTSPAPGECGRSPNVNFFSQYILDGENATEGSWPWMAAITSRETSGAYSSFCSGFLIDRRHLLSAAHCYPVRDPDRYRALIGHIDQRYASEYRITQITPHSGYTAGLFYDDIAILTLDRDVDFPNFNPVCLPDQEISRMVLEGRGTTVVGWGAERPRGGQTVILKQLSRIPVVSNPDCQRKLRETLRNVFQRQFPRGITRNIICAGFDEGGKDSCNGDSGGPLMIRNSNRWFAIGIVSFGFSCGRPGVPAGYTKISNYLDWIRQNI